MGVRRRGTFGRMRHRMRDVGGTPGGLPLFALGLGMAAGGAYLLTNQVQVHSGYWRFWGEPTFGLTLLPLLFGVGFLFWNGRSALGWVLTGLGAVFIFAGIIANLQIHFQSTTLFNTLVILTLLVGGLGLIARSLRPVGRN
jgi:hypothetical protein